MSNLTVLRMSSVPRTTTSKKPCAVPLNMFSPADVVSMGGSILVYSSILDSTPQVNSGSMKSFDDPESTKSWKLSPS